MSNIPISIWSCYVCVLLHISANMNNNKFFFSIKKKRTHQINIKRQFNIFHGNSYGTWIYIWIHGKRLKIFFNFIWNLMFNLNYFIFCSLVKCKRGTYVVVLRYVHIFCMTPWLMWKDISFLFYYYFCV